MREIIPRTHAAPQRTWINEARLNDRLFHQKPQRDGFHYFLTSFPAKQNSGRTKMRTTGRGFVHAPAWGGDWDAPPHWARRSSFDPRPRVGGDFTLLTRRFCGMKFGASAKRGDCGREGRWCESGVGRTPDLAGICAGREPRRVFGPAWGSRKQAPVRRRAIRDEWLRAPTGKSSRPKGGNDPLPAWAGFRPAFRRAVAARKTGQKPHC